MNRRINERITRAINKKGNQKNVALPKPKFLEKEQKRRCKQREHRDRPVNRKRKIRHSIVSQQTKAKKK
ncbi:hypothetical protein [Paenibacillus tianmuensis]|uniref:hypothetical protein n=1 Tax=Paenibacillus tianmuensis TaxID=624147 RepID=UPI001FE13557|nr:hypothetical protein [Paenibacillus tianmuensis]